MGVDKPLVTVRDFIPGEAADLRDVFMSSVHGLARRFYTEEQIKAWAPVTHGQGQWADRIAALRPFVATVDGRVAAMPTCRNPAISITSSLQQSFLVKAWVRC